ncbi:Uncharacterized protein TCM_002782 [Theobroma cacao]|uniref:Reverse transcriptase domain-containing protein n=1 Tax=Theobroma cacao TaxID=3641 RepID=A0A061DP17_THECC|nr:Uncharacterized protein TCM_002782 [Theobroma cacao]
MGSIRALSALQVQLEKMKKEPQQGLIYIEVLLNVKRTKAMLDTKGSNTFITLGEAKICNFKDEKDLGQMKIVNLTALTIIGNSKDVKTNHTLVTFCTLLNKEFRDYLDKFMVIYLDDIVVYNLTLEEHQQHLR